MINENERNAVKFQKGYDIFVNKISIGDEVIEMILKNLSILKIWRIVASSVIRKREKLAFFIIPKIISQ